MRPAKVSATTGPADIRSITGCSPAGSGGKSPRFLPIPHDISDLPNRRRSPAPGFRFISLYQPQGMAGRFGHALGTKVRDLVDITKMRWRIERDYQELKQEIGLDHYEGR